MLILGSQRISICITYTVLAEDEHELYHEARGTKKAAVLDISSHFSAVAFLILGCQIETRSKLELQLFPQEKDDVPYTCREGSHVTDPGSQRRGHVILGDAIGYFVSRGVLTPRNCATGCAIR